jgi:cytoskeletal protein RodZ
MAAFFKTKKVSTETLGEYLQDTRKAARLTIPQINRLTRIQEKFLRSLEEGDYEALPADVYVKGFLKTMAEVYHVPANTLLEQFERERGLERSLENDPLRPKGSVASQLPRFVITPRTFTVVVVAVLALASLGYLVWQIRSVQAPPSLEILYPEKDAKIETRSVLLRGKTEPGSRVFVNNQEIMVEENGAFSEVLNLSEGANNLAIRAENKFRTATGESRTVMVKTAQSLATSTPEQAENLISLTVAVGPENTWITARADNDVVQDGIVEAGQSLKLRAEKELILTTGNAGSTHLIYNGRDLGILGRAGEVLSGIRFTR